MLVKLAPQLLFLLKPPPLNSAAHFGNKYDFKAAVWRTYLYIKVLYNFKMIVGFRLKATALQHVLFFLNSAFLP